MNIDEIIKRKRNEILEISTRYGAKEIKIFGSALRGEAKTNSDVDLLVELEPGRSLLDIIAIKQDLEDLLGCKVDIVTEAALSPYIRDEVLNQAVRL
jgi:predicted nucleotidyltransferase